MIYKGYIYKITNKINNHCYIGQTVRTLEERWYEHTKDSTIKDKTNTIYRAFRKYGLENFTFEEIETVTSEDFISLCNQLDEREIFWIDYYNSYNDGYNMTKGGQFKADKFYDNIFCIPVDVYKLDGTFVKTFDSLTEASLKLDVQLSCISQCINGKCGYSKDYVFRIHGEEFNLYEIDRTLKYKKPVFQFDRYGNLINNYTSIKEVSRILHISGITRALNHPDRTCGGYWWSTENHFDGHKAFKNTIDQYSLDGVYIKTFDGLVEVEKETGFLSSAIQGVCVGRCTQAYSFVWRYSCDDLHKFKLPHEIVRYKIIPIKQYDLLGNLVAEFNSYNEASEKTGIDIKKIKSCCKGNQKTADGFVFRKYDEPFDYHDDRIRSNVLQMDLEWNYVYVFDTTKEAHEILNIAESCIQDCIMGRQESTKGFKFKRITIEEGSRIRRLLNQSSTN